MSDIDTLRWGDTQTLRFTEAGAGPASLVGPAETKQLVHAHWPRPLTWKLMLVIQPQVPANETANFAASFLVTLGVGAGMVQIPLGATLFTLAGGYQPVTLFFELPAQDVQVFATVDVSLAVSTQGMSFLFGAYIAPLTEPAGYTEIRDTMLRVLDRERPPTDSDSQGMPHWMPPGFDDGELRYRGGR